MYTLKFVCLKGESTYQYSKELEHWTSYMFFWVLPSLIIAYQPFRTFANYLKNPDPCWSWTNHILVVTLNTSSYRHVYVLIFIYFYVQYLHWHIICIVISEYNCWATLGSICGSFFPTILQYIIVVCLAANSCVT